MEKKVENNIRVVQMANYTSPVDKEIRGNEWVAYGEDNNYFQYLIDRYNGSPTNNACINGISQMIYGRGLDAINGGDNPTDYAKFLTLMELEFKASHPSGYILVTRHHCKPTLLNS